MVGVSAAERGHARPRRKRGGGAAQDGQTLVRESAGAHVASDRDAVHVAAGADGVAPSAKAIRRTVKGTPSEEAQALAHEFLSELDAEMIADPHCALACLIQGIRDGADERNAERITTLDGHRNQWRRIAFRLEEELRKHDKAAGDAIFENARPVHMTADERALADVRAIVENWDRIDLRDPDTVHTRLVQIEDALLSNGLGEGSKGR